MSYNDEAVELLGAELLLSQVQHSVAPCRGGAALAVLYQSLLCHFDAKQEDQHAAEFAEDVGTATRPSLRVDVDLVREAGRGCFGLECAIPVTGCGITTCGSVLLITGIDRGGCVEAWNDLCVERCEPWKRLHLCAAVLSVNGVDADVRRMQRELEMTTHAQLVVCNPPTVRDMVIALRIAHHAAPAPFGGPFWDVPTADSFSVVRAVLPVERGVKEDAKLLGDEGLAAREALAVASYSKETSAVKPTSATEPFETYTKLTAACPDVSVIITTSPVPSNPSTGMLQCVLGNLSLIPPLERAKKLLVCDGYAVVGHGRKPKHKAGRITADDAERYGQFKHAVRALVAAATAACDKDVGGPRSDVGGSRGGSSVGNGGSIGLFAHLQVLELVEHVGFGHAVKRALDEVDTDFVLVLQHDQQFIRGFALAGVLRAMTLYPQRLKYVGLCSATTQHYEHSVLSKYGLRLQRTCEFGVPLMPLIFFYDKPHICSRRYYQEVIFGEDSPVRRGDFIEETHGKAQRADILLNGMGVHDRYGTYQLDDRDQSGETLVVVRHINGRAFLTPEQRVARGWPACLRFQV